MSFSQPPEGQTTLGADWQFAVHKSMTTAAPGGSGLAGQAWRVSVSSELQLFWVQREASSRPHGLVRLLLVSTRER